MPNVDESGFGKPKPLTSTERNRKHRMKEEVKIKERRYSRAYHEAQRRRASQSEANALAYKKELLDTAAQLEALKTRVDEMESMRIRMQPEAAAVMSLLRTVRNSEVDARVQCLRSMDEDSKLTYGELQPAFAYRLLEDEKLDHKSCFVDLGSGIGNLVIQAAVQCGCKAFGIELREDLHAVAVDSLAFAQSQCFQRGIHMGTVHLLQGDMLNSAPVQTWISSADVLFVNNKAFDATLNQRILDSLLIKLKHGAVIVSTMVFIESKRLRNGKTRAILPDGLQKSQGKSHACSQWYMTAKDGKLGSKEYWCSDGTRLEIFERQYPRGSVSWADAAGVYYWHRIYKEGEQRIKQDTLDSIFYQR